MKLPLGKQTWSAGVLVVLAVILVWNLARQYRAMQPGGASAPVFATHRLHSPAGKSVSHAADDLAEYDPTVHFDSLKSLDSRPLPDEDRDPFQFVGGVAAPVVAQAAGPAPQVAPTPPPPPPLKAVGYNELPGGGKEAMVTFNDDLQVVHEGDMVGVKFKVLTISPSMVVVENGDTHEKIDLPIPQ